MAPAVWFATFSEEPDREINARNKEIMDQLAADESLTGEHMDWPEWDREFARQCMAMMPIGPVPSTSAGFACTEARREMESLIPQPWKVGVNSKVCWIHWETTVIHLGRFDNASRFYARLYEHERAWIRHAAFECPGWRKKEATWITADLSHGSPDLRTLIVHMRAIDNVEIEWEEAQALTGLYPEVLAPELIPTSRTASLYRRRLLLKPTRSEISEARVTSQPNEQVQWNRLGRKEMRNAFDDADFEFYTPRIHILHLDPACY